jgi:hypothetical protein
MSLKPVAQRLEQLLGRPVKMGGGGSWPTVVAEWAALGGIIFGRRGPYGSSPFPVVAVR